MAEMPDDRELAPICPQKVHILVYQRPFSYMRSVDTVAKWSQSTGLGLEEKLEVYQAAVKLAVALASNMGCVCLVWRLVSLAEKC